MIVFKPYEIEDSEITSNASVTIDSSTVFIGTWQGEWDSLVTYSDTDVVYKNNSIYESQNDSNTDDPEAGISAVPPTWLYISETNPYRMFDNYVGTDYLSGTYAPTGGLTIEFTTDQVGQVALFNIIAETLTVQILNNADEVQWSETYDLLEDIIAVDNWYDYFFSPYQVPYQNLVIELGYITSANYNEKVKLTFTGSPVFCSNCFIGSGIQTGNTEWDPSISAYNTGSTETDEYTRASFVSGENFKSIKAKVRPESNMEDYILNVLSNLQNQPAVYDFNNDDTDFSILTIYGAITSMTQTMPGINDTTIDIEITGIVAQEE